MKWRIVSFGLIPSWTRAEILVLTAWLPFVVCRCQHGTQRLHQFSCPPNLPECAFHFSAPCLVPALKHKRNLREKHLSARLSYMGRVLGLQQLLGVWVPLADVCYSSHFINFGNKTPDYSWPKHPLFDWQPVCVSYDINHPIALATYF